MKTDEDEYWFGTIIDHLAGELSTESENDLQDWLSLSATNRKFYEEVQAVWQLSALAGDDPLFDSDKAFASHQGRVQTRRKRVTMRRIFSYAAVVVPLLVVGFLSHSYYSLKSEYHSALVKLEIPHGSQTQMELKDGSKIWINSGSKIEIDANFGIENRHIRFEGEAYVEVAKDEKMPFLISTKEIDIKVLGTKFNLKSYQNDEEVRVALLEGSVEMIPTEGQSSTLKPNDLARYNVSTKQIQVDSNSDLGNALAWKNNHLVFSGDRFKEIVTVLERRFDVNITIHNNDINSRRYVGEFVEDETLEQIFKIMSISGHFEYEIKGNKVNVY